MAFDYHEKRELNFNYQILNTQDYIIPFINEKFKIKEGIKVMEVGCGEGGVLKPFADMGCICTGVDLHEYKINLANEYLSDYVKDGKIKFIYKDIYDLAEDKSFWNSYDLIILKDTLEHIHGHDRIIKTLKIFLNSNGHMYFGFPPWHMPYGGHQQVCSNKLLSLTPYYHLLPNFIYKNIFKLFKEDEGLIDFLMETKETRITPSRFEKIIRSENLEVVNRKFYLVNPIYKYKVNLKPVEQFKVIEIIPFVRNFLTTTCDYLIKTT